MVGRRGLPGKYSRLAGLALLLYFWFSGVALALDYRSVGAESAILYDSPSLHGKRLFVVDKYYPVEIIVNLDQWAKVRDITGSLAWIEKKNLSSVHMVLVTAALADVRQSADLKAPLVFQAERDVALELVEYGAAGWLKVRHRDGQVGFVQASQVWGS